MKKYLIVLLSLALLSPWLGFAPPMEAAQAPPPGSDLARQAPRQRAMDAYLKLPLYFIANQGQMDGRVGYYVQGGGHSLYFTAEEVVMALEETVLRMRFVGAKATPPVGVEKTTATVNHLIGNDPAQWRTDIPTYGEVVYHELYSGIDLRYAGQRGALKYTFVVQPGADVSQIRLAYGGAAGLRLDEAGNLLILAGGDELKDTKPYAYQEIGGRRVEVETEFVLHGVRTCGFAVRSDYDPRHPLIIDPTLLYSTYLGGSSGDVGSGIAVDGDGYTYVTGATYSNDFPTQNPYQATTAYNYDVFVSKIDTNQSGAASLVYSTYLGGSSNDFGEGIAVDGAGQAYVTGWTDSTDFPTTTGAFDTTCGTDGTCNFTVSFYYSDAFVTKLNAAGNTLDYSTYLGGSSYDYGYGIAVDGAGHAYVTGSTSSTDFPTPNAYDNSYNLNQDAFVTKLNVAGSALDYSTYLGGGSNDYGNGIAVDGGQAYVTGWTYSTDFPTQNAYDNSYNLSQDAFVTKLNAAGSALLYSTYLGGSSSDYGRGIAVDGAGQAYVTGATYSNDFPTPNAYDSSYNGNWDAFVTKLNGTGNGLLYSTYLGGSNSDGGYGIAVDGAGQAYVTGSTSSNNFPTPNAYDNSLGGFQDAFVTKLNAAGNALDYSTYLGGSSGGGGAVRSLAVGIIDGVYGGEEGYGIAVDGDGHAYVTGGTPSNNFPTPNAYDSSLDGGGAGPIYGANSEVARSTQNAYDSSLGGASLSNNNTAVIIYVGMGDAFVSKLGPPPVLSIGKSDTPDPVSPAGLLTYTIVVSETGGLVNAHGVQVTDTVPMSTTCCAAIGQGGSPVGNDVVWSGLTIPMGQSITLTFVVTVGQVPSGTIITNHAYRVVTSTVGVSTGLGSAVNTTVSSAENYVYLPLIWRPFLQPGCCVGQE